MLTSSDSDIDGKGQPIAIPLTPPQEPDRRGLATHGVLTQLADAPAPADLSLEQQNDNGCGVGAVEDTRSHSGIKTIDHSSADHETCESVPHQNQWQAVPRPASIHGKDSILRRSSSEIGGTLAERRSLRRQSQEGLKDITKRSDTSSVAILSPTLSVRSINIDGAQAQSRALLSVEENQILQTRSPSLSDASHRASLERSPDNPPRPRNLTIDVKSEAQPFESRPRPARLLSTPASIKSPNLFVVQDHRKSRANSKGDQPKPRNVSTPRYPLPSPIPATIPIPPLSLPTYLQLELSSQRPSQVYIHCSLTNDFPYESSRVKVERLLNFLFLPHQLEGVLWFGVLASLDVWLYTFTILPLRMIKSIYILGKSLAQNFGAETRFVADYILAGSQRMYERRRSRGQSIAPAHSRSSPEPQIQSISTGRVKSRIGKHHRSMKSMPSLLQPDDKADILKGLLIIATCAVLLKLDASRMYHSVRGQGAVKLYVVYNLLEVCDRLLSAIGQDVLECLFSQEALERKPDGHSKILRPAWLFVLALAYSVIHATALFYQVVTLNVAVNSYNNALITLLMSNQFVEIKGTVFKKFERENLFQVTCADIVERFQLWHMLMIIAARNVVETGMFSPGPHSLLSPGATATSSSSPNITQAAPPLSAASILPRSFMIVPSFLSSVGSYVPTVSHVLGPFIIVLGSEMFIDWLKHAYINKFNNIRPVIYGRFLDVLAKDYYTNAFGEQNLTKRLGLPVIPLSCLMIRAGFQTYQMLVASWVPAPSSSNAATLVSIHQEYSTTRAVPTSTAGMIVRTMDDLLGQLPTAISNSPITTYFTTTLVILLMFLVLLVCKLILGMGLLAFSRSRYAAMKEREHAGNPIPYVEGGRRIGGWGVVEVDDEKRRVIYEDDPAALQMSKAKETKDKARKEQEKDNGYGTEGLEKVRRYELGTGKRIW